MGSMSKDRFYFDLDAVDVSGSSVELGATTLAALENITVSATDLDIRNLVFADDKADVSGSTVELGATTLAALETITVTATDLDIRNLVFATDKADVSGSEVSLDSATLAALENVVVSATDLDIRNLVFSDDKVDVSGSEVSLDSATLAALENINVTMASPNVACKATLKTATTTAAVVVTSPLASRLKLSIQNNGDKSIFIGDSAVTASTGTEIKKGQTWMEDLGAAMGLYMITATGSNTGINTLEFS
jgi:hypothetical protein